MQNALITKMIIRTFLSAYFLCVGSLFAFAETTKTKPNILYIMADDLGKEWISCYGAEDIETPNIDALATGGMKFNNAYSMPACTPSRTTLLTGKYPWRTGYRSRSDCRCK
jgi:arylsulfatase A-like enzyme